MFRIGTAGWTIPSRYREMLAGSGSHLERYAQRLNAVEINSSFRRHHRFQTYARWASAVPTNFRFCVKVPGTLTHKGALAPHAELLDQFIEEVRGLGRKLGVLLVQLPPRLAFDEPVVRVFFDMLCERIDAQIVCEPRHPSWSARRANGVLEEYAVARAAADPAPWPGAQEPGGYKRFTYFRWHGHPRKYYSGYDVERLSSLEQQMRVAGERATEVWAIFDNTVLGCALENALTTAEGIAKIRAQKRSRKTQ